MEEKPRKEGLLEKAAQALDLPGEVVAGLPLITLAGDRELRMENHKGILAYGKEEIHVGGNKIIVKIKGSSLELRSMNAYELVITGHIIAVELS